MNVSKDVFSLQCWKWHPPWISSPLGLMQIDGYELMMIPWRPSTLSLSKHLLFQTSHQEFPRSFGRTKQNQKTLGRLRPLWPSSNSAKSFTFFAPFLKYFPLYEQQLLPNRPRSLRAWQGSQMNTIKAPLRYHSRCLKITKKCLTFYAVFLLRK